MIVAKNKSGSRIYAGDVDSLEVRHMDLFGICCDEPLSFVNGVALRIDGRPRSRHFRHRPASQCTAGEPETEEHIQGKLAVKRFIDQTRLGVATVEYRLDDFVADVYWERPNSRDMAIEVQATNYATEKYIDKIAAYRKKDLMVLYLFIPGDFYKAHRDRVIHAKAIERALLFDHAFGTNVGSAYLYQIGDKWVVETPWLERKWARGGHGIAVNERVFFKKQLNNERKSADSFFRTLGKIEDSWWPVFDNIQQRGISPPIRCPHSWIRPTVNGEGTQRWSIRCAICGTFDGWFPKTAVHHLGLPDSTLQNLGSIGQVVSLSELKASNLGIKFSKFKN